MRTKVQKWGNSLALRIPKSFAADIQLKDDSVVDISLVDGKIVLIPVELPKWTLDQLLAGITKENIHQEIDTGASQENEAW